jgi:protein involved in polysaccharide export with SLBB domain
MDARWTHTLALRVLIGALLLSGCEASQQLSESLKLKTDPSRLLAPDLVVNAEKAARSPINPILTSVGMVDQISELPPNATFPRPGDWSYVEEDYRVGPADLLEVGILGLYQSGSETILRRQVTESGYIDLPFLPEPLLVRDKTVAELRKLIASAYEPGILRNPTVSVTVLQRRQNTFSILGSINRPGTYQILRNDMRLMEALALGGGIVTRNLDYIFVIRPAPAEAVQPEQARPAEPQPSPQPTLPAQEPEPEGGEEAPAEPVTEPTREPGGEGVIDIDSALRELGGAAPGPSPETEPSPPTPSERPSLPLLSDGDAAGAAAPTANATTDAATAPAKEPEYEWVFRDGRWQRMQKGVEEVPATQPRTVEQPPDREMPEVAPPEERAPGELPPPVRRRDLAELPGEQPPPQEREDPFGWKALDKSDLSRVIAINLQALRQGDQQMNIVIRPNDIVYVPILEGAEIYVTGEVLRPGPVNVTGRKVTVKQAISFAGGFSALAWPENAILVRRVGNNQEQIIPLDLEAIYLGEEPDLYLKPDDVIAVGSSWRSPFYAVMRNAFRMTYGFGFIYDRNFADPLLITPTHKRFTRW